MADITMCLNEDCKLADDCRRKTAVASPFNQSYADFKYEVSKDGIVTCDNYLFNGREGIPKTLLV